MKIYRAGRKSRKWNTTDAKRLKNLIRDWAPGKIVSVDGTIDKGGERHTDFGLEVEPHDIVALQRALSRYQLRRLSQLDKENQKLKTTIQKLELGLARIKALTMFCSHDAPSDKELVGAVAELAHHYVSEYERDKPLPKRKWVNWKKIDVYT